MIVVSCSALIIVNLFSPALYACERRERERAGAVEKAVERVVERAVEREREGERE